MVPMRWSLEVHQILTRSDSNMSGFERILARVGGDALRDYCSSAIEDELKNLKEKMQLCLASVEKAIVVQDAILKLNVPLTGNAATFAAIQSGYQKFNDDLDKFIKEQRKVCALKPSTCVDFAAHDD